MSGMFFGTQCISIKYTRRDSYAKFGTFFCATSYIDLLSSFDHTIHWPKTKRAKFHSNIQTSLVLICWTTLHNKLSYDVQIKSLNSKQVKPSVRLNTAREYHADKSTFYRKFYDFDLWSLTLKLVDKVNVLFFAQNFIELSAAVYESFW